LFVAKLKSPKRATTDPNEFNQRKRGAGGMKKPVTPPGKRGRSPAPLAKTQDRIRASTSADRVMADIDRHSETAPFLPNWQDMAIVARLRSASPGTLPIDRYADGLSLSIPALRLALIQIYQDAAKARYHRRATRQQRTAIRRARAALTEAVSLLERAGSDGRDALTRTLEGPRQDDMKGEHERSAFADLCDSIKLELTAPLLKLELLVERDDRKPAARGRPRVRLRTLVDALADWWQSMGHSIAPTVDVDRRQRAKGKPRGAARRRRRPTVFGRHGQFLKFATALLCQLDHFEFTEVEAAVTNVHEARATG
jgi:hypothetical protein